MNFLINRRHGRQLVFRIGLSLILTLVLGVTLVLANQPGDRDATFGVNGVVTTNIGTGADAANATVIQTDGKIVVAGSSWNGKNFDFALVRYNSNGTLDSTFGTAGKVTTAIGAGTTVGSGNDMAYAVAIQTDGKIVVAGTGDNGLNGDFALIRYTSEGKLDTAFGTGGKVLTAIGANSDIGQAIAIQSDGKIVVAGRIFRATLNDDIAVVRYTSQGALDTSFGMGGKVTTDFANGFDHGYGMAIQSDGKIVVVGSSWNGSLFNFIMARYTSNGALDSTFGTSGKIMTTFGNNHSEAESIAIQTDGKLVVAGYSGGTTSSNFSLARYNSNGTLDSTFGTGGGITTDFGGQEDLGQAVVVLADGKIVVVGQSNNGDNKDVAMARYTNKGVLDSAWGIDGKVITVLSNTSDDGASSVARQTDGKIVVAGYSNGDFAIARYLSDMSTVNVYLPLVLK